MFWTKISHVLSENIGRLRSVFTQIKIQNLRFSNTKPPPFKGKASDFCWWFLFYFIYGSLIFKSKISGSPAKNQWKQNKISVIFDIKITDFYLKNQWYLYENKVKSTLKYGMFLSQTSYVFVTNTVCLLLKHRMFFGEIRDVFVKNIPYLQRKYPVSSLQTFSVFRCLSLFARRLFVLVKIKFQVDFLKITLKTWRDDKKKSCKTYLSLKLKDFLFFKIIFGEDTQS